MTKNVKSGLIAVIVILAIMVAAVGCSLSAANDQIEKLNYDLSMREMEIDQLHTDIAHFEADPIGYFTENQSEWAEMDKPTVAEFFKFISIINK